MFSRKHASLMMVTVMMVAMVIRVKTVAVMKVIKFLVCAAV